MGDHQRPPIPPRRRYLLISRPSVRRAATIRLTTTKDMVGAGSDLISLAAGTALDIAGLVVAVAAYRQSRRTVRSVTIRRGDVEVTITGTDDAALTEAATLLETATRQP